MKLILRADVDNLGRLGDVVTVKPGFGRNYLVPQGLAMPATDSNLKVFELERKALQEKMDSIRMDFERLAERIAETKIEIEVRVGDSGKLYGSVTTANIADELAAAGLDIDRRKILLDEPIRTVGDFTIPIRLHPDVTAELAVCVFRHVVPGEEAVEEAPAQEAAAPEAPAETQQVEESEPAAEPEQQQEG